MRNRDNAAQAFLYGRTNSVKGSVATDGETIWSYGTHFPMAFRDERGRIWVNEDKYSVTTSGHQGALRRVLTNAGLRPSEDETNDLCNFIVGNAPMYTYRKWVS